MEWRRSLVWPNLYWTRSCCVLPSIISLRGTAQYCVYCVQWWSRRAGTRWGSSHHTIVQIRNVPNWWKWSHDHSSTWIISPRKTVVYLFITLDAWLLNTWTSITTHHWTCGILISPSFRIFFALTIRNITLLILYNNLSAMIIRIINVSYYC